jgi:hypothetical protein
MEAVMDKADDIKARYVRMYDGITAWLEAEVGSSGADVPLDIPRILQALEARGIIYFDDGEEHEHEGSWFMPEQRLRNADEMGTPIPDYPGAKPHIARVTVEYVKDLRTGTAHSGDDQ